MSDLQNAFGELGEELKDTVNSDDGRNLLRELGQQLQRMADGIDNEESNSEEEHSEEPDLQMVFDEDSVEVIEPEEWVEQLVEDIKGKTEPPQTDAEKEKTEDTIEIPSKSALNRLKKSDLINLAEQLGVKFDSKGTKATIITAIDNAR